MLMEKYIDKTHADRAADLYKICESETKIYSVIQAIFLSLSYLSAALIKAKLYLLAFVPCQVYTSQDLI